MRFGAGLGAGSGGVVIAEHGSAFLALATAQLDGGANALKEIPHASEYKASLDQG